MGRKKNQNCVSCCVAVSEYLVCGRVGCVSVLLLMCIGVCRDNDPKEWIFITWTLFLYKCTLLLVLLHVEEG
jgi:hypothetical protein